MSTKGWNSLKPITTPDQMSAPIHWNPMNEDWKMRLAKSQIYNTSSGFDTQTLDAMKKLHDKILTFGGDEVCMTMFEFAFCTPCFQTQQAKPQNPLPCAAFQQQSA